MSTSSIEAARKRRRGREKACIPGYNERGLLRKSDLPEPLDQVGSVLCLERTTTAGRSLFNSVKQDSVASHICLRWTHRANLPDRQMECTISCCSVSLHSPERKLLSRTRSTIQGSHSLPTGCSIALYLFPLPPSSSQTPPFFLSPFPLHPISRNTKQERHVSRDRRTSQSRLKT